MSICRLCPRCGQWHSLQHPCAFMAPFVAQMAAARCEPGSQRASGRAATPSGTAGGLAPAAPWVVGGASGGGESTDEASARS
jgi:hypothetical protein